jgi:hypothetical protein
MGRFKLGRPWRAAGLALLAGIAATPARAAPENGVGLMLGAVAAREDTMNSAGVSVGLDAQFAVDERWSLNPTLLASAEQASSQWKVSDGMVGLQVRRWFRAAYVGLHAFYHVRVIVRDGTVSNSAYGVAGGLVGGYEGPSGWGAQVQLDALENSGVPSVYRNAVRAHATYRWR